MGDRTLKILDILLELLRELDNISAIRLFIGLFFLGSNFSRILNSFKKV